MIKYPIEIHTEVEMKECYLNEDCLIKSVLIEVYLTMTNLFLRFGLAKIKNPHTHICVHSYLHQVNASSTRDWVVVLVGVDVVEVVNSKWV